MAVPNLDHLFSDIHDLPGALQLADWRCRIAQLYSELRNHSEPYLAWRHWRATRDLLACHHPQSPVIGRLIGARLYRYFDYAPELRFEVGTREIGDPQCVEMDCGPDGRIVLESWAKTDGLADALGAELTLFWIQAYGGGIFLPFRDATSGTASYGGGRYLLDTIKGADLGTRNGRLILDFNFAYNPSCCYSSQWTCPLAPAENRLDAAITAGERDFSCA